MTRRRKIILYAAAVLAVAYMLCLPRNLFKGTVYSTVVEDRNGELLGAHIASDGQWRFPPSDTIPERYKTALIQFEDRYFRYHPGVNPVSIIRALAGNIKAGHVTSGGSTITMQVIRMSRGKERNLWQKLIEAVLATRLELRCSKNRILAMYAAHAPFGGNVVGLEAASWRYFGRPSSQLSWAEAATLAILPNSPSGVHPGKNRDKLLEKRNRLLHNLLDAGKIDAETYELAVGEPLVMQPHPLPRLAPHLTDNYYLTDGGKTIRTSIDAGLQRQVCAVADRWSRDFAKTGVGDLAAVVVDVHTGEVLAYCGNADPDRERPGRLVDIASAPRSTGSILKPMLYCALLQEGQMLPGTLLPDIPININGFSPQNFDRQFSGAVHAGEALARSLNVPAVHMLREYGVPKFLDLLRASGMTTLDRSAADYGLSLILGGAEGRLVDITRMYAGLSRSYQTKDSTFALNDKAAIWHTLDALKEVNRPDEIDWHLIRSVRRVAWKTGTSYGFRDGWAVGMTPDYAVGVWAGNAQGEGVPGLTGARTAGPVMFDIFNLLPVGDWFEEPLPSDYIRAEICPQSGHLRSLNCPQADTLHLPKRALRSSPCPYHTPDGSFVLPPGMEWYYRQNHPEYHGAVRGTVATMEFIYPDSGSTIFIPRQIDGSVKGAVFHLAHRDRDATVYWHMDNGYLGETRHIHQMTLSPSPGHHVVTVVDGSGNTLSVSFNVAE
ncbi:penicillin-binding protein 1C [Bacteroidales bacterium WCE2008]|nr:penicillin-binding protein 1C [Bacteroidales bacterium WCE2008]